MRILRTEKVQVYGNPSVKKVQEVAVKTMGKDSVVFSSFAKELQLAKKAIKEAPDARMELIEDLKARVESGKYNVTANQIAEKIVG